MDAIHEEISVRGKATTVRATRINDRVIVVTGKRLRIAAVKDEQWLEGDPVKDPVFMIRKLKEERPKVDIFTFAQSVPDTIPRYKYDMGWDNVAAIPLTSFTDWWEKRLPQETRKNVRRARRRGVLVKVVTFDDALVQGIVEINNNVPERQRRPFWHYGKDFETIRCEYSTFQDRSDFIGAYYQGELIGVCKLVYLGEVASILQLLSKVNHADKRPSNVLLAKAVELCAEKGIRYLLYGKYTYGKKKPDQLTEFKRRNGFEKIAFPRYYVPLSLKGAVAIRLGLQLGLIGILPAGLLSILLKIRSAFYRNIRLRSRIDDLSADRRGSAVIDEGPSER